MGCTALIRSYTRNKICGNEMALGALEDPMMLWLNIARRIDNIESRPT